MLCEWLNFMGKIWDQKGCHTHFLYENEIKINKDIEKIKAYQKASCS